jgi:hypothetical protein
MTEKTPDERVWMRNEDEADVEGHHLKVGPEDPSEPGRVAAKDEGTDESTDESGWLKS